MILYSLVNPGADLGGVDGVASHPPFLLTTPTFSNKMVKTKLVLVTFSLPDHFAY